MAAMAEPKSVDPALTRIISVVAAPQLCRNCVAYPIIYTATIDEAVNSQGFIVPVRDGIVRLALFLCFSP